MSKKKEKEDEVVPARYGMVVWSDGGARPTNPGPAGWGVHGYYFNAVKPKKGTGNPDLVLTTMGYVSKSEFQNSKPVDITEKDWEAIKAGKLNKPFEVTPLHYIDGNGTFAEYVTNNVAELTAFIRTLEYAREYQLDYLLVISDSKYVIDCAEKWMDGWARKNWIRRDKNTGVESAIPNVELWKRALELRDEMKNRGVKIAYRWVKGHTGAPGNTEADHAATAGTQESQKNLRMLNINSRSTVESIPADGYWKYDPERHPFLANRRMYFNGSEEYNKPGVYQLGEHGKEDELVAKRTSLGAYALIYLDQPDPVLELVRKKQFEFCYGNMVCMAHLDEVYKPITHRQICRFGEHSILRRRPEKLDTMSLSEAPLVTVFDPPRLAHRVADAMDVLHHRLGQFLANDPQITVTDLTGILYESTTKTVKKAKGEAEAASVSVMTLKPEYNTGFASLQVDAHYTLNGELKSAPVILVLSIDMLNRNSLKRLESLQPQVSLITWMESDQAFRYATVVKAGEDVGIWAGFYSNIRVLT